MLTRLVIRRMRLLRDVTVDLPPGRPLVLVGGGASGKSTVLEALDTLANLSSGDPSASVHVPSIRTAGQTDAPEIEATLALPSVTGTDTTTVRYGVRLGPEGEAEREWFDVTGDPGRPASLHVFAGDASMVAFYNRDGQGAPPHAAILRARAALGAARVYPTGSLAPRDATRDGAVLSSRTVLDRAGADLVNVLYHLHTEHDGVWSALLEHLRAEFPHVTRLEFPADATVGRVTLAWRDQRFPGVRFTARQMSDAMAAWIALLAALLAPARPGILAFDEPDSWLPPTATRRLAHLVETVAQRSTVVLTTRSARILDALTDPAASVRVCEAGASGVTVRALDHDALARWSRDYTLVTPP